MKKINQFNWYWNKSVHCKPIPVMKTGFSLCSFSHREKPVFITGIPANENSFSLCGNTTQGKPCSDPVLALYGIAVYPNSSNAIFSKSSNPCTAGTLCNFVFELISNFCSHSECVTRVSIYAIREAAWSIKFSCATISTWWSASDMSDWQDRKCQNIILGLQIACFQNKAS